MLQSIRDRSQSWISIIIIGFLIVMFALWGISYYLGGDSGASAVMAKVNGQKINAEQFQSFYAQLRQAEADAIDSGQVTIPELKKEALQSLISNEVLYQAATSAGLGISSTGVDEIIATLPAFQKDGKFSNSLLQQFLRYRGLTIDGLREKIHRSLVLNQWKLGLYGSSFVLPSEVDQYWVLANQSRHFSAARVLASSYASKVRVSQSDIEAYYKAHPKAFTTPEQVQLAYLSLSQADMAKNIQVTTDQAKAYFETNTAQFTTPEKRRASLILIALPQSSSAADSQKAEQKVNTIEKAIKAGDSFSTLAKQDSQDPVSAKKGGDLGWQSIGTSPVSKALFDLNKVGQVSEPFKTPYGWAIVKYTGLQAAKVPSFESVKASVIASMKKAQAEKAYADIGNQMANLTFQSPSSLKPAAKQLGLTVQTTGWISRKGAKSGVASNDQVLKAAFSDDVLTSGNNSQPINVSDTQAVVIRLLKHKPSKLEPLSSVEAQIKADVSAKKAMEAAEETAQAAVEALRHGDALDAVSKRYGLSFKSQTAQMTDQTPLSRAAFSTFVPTKGHPVAALSVVPNKGYDVVRVDSVTLGKKPAQENIQATQLLLERLLGLSIYNEYQQATESQAKITDRVNASSL